MPVYTIKVRPHFFFFFFLGERWTPRPLFSKFSMCLCCGYKMNQHTRHSPWLQVCGLKRDGWHDAGAASFLHRVPGSDGPVWDRQPSLLKHLLSLAESSARCTVQDAQKETDDNSLGAGLGIDRQLQSSQSPYKGALWVPFPERGNGGQNVDGNPWPCDCKSHGLSILPSCFPSI